MTQLFSPTANLVLRAALALAALAIVGFGVVSYGYVRSPYVTGEDLVHEQPVPFSHRHHVEGVGLDCRYCHTSVEDSSFAGIPPTEICMNCHTQIWSESPMLEPVRASYANGTPLQWTRVHDLPEFVFFNHSIHVAKGIGCATCHGRVDTMALTRQTEPLYMLWCLDCHRDPAKFLRPRDQVFNMNYQPPEDQRSLGARLLDQYDIRPTRGLTDCVTCHR